jgi:hypothetical protein
MASKSARRWALALASVASIMVALDTLVVSTALTTIRLDLDATVEGIAITVAVFAGTGGYASAQAFSDGFVPAIAVTAALALAGAMTGLVMPSRRQATAFEPGREIRSTPDASPCGHRMASALDAEAGS